MKLLCFLFLAIVLPIQLFAQDSYSDSQTESIVERINMLEPGKGTVKVIQDEQISGRIGRPGVKNVVHPISSSEHKYIELSGWRIQVFSGNNQRISKNEAFRKETDVKTTFPEMSTYVKYNAPFWRLRVGDFQTYQDAQRMLIQLRHTFPAFGREMSIVKEKIQVKVQ